MKKKIIMFLIFTGMVFICSCEKIDFPKDTPIAIKNLIKKFPKYDGFVVREYKYRNQKIYTFDYIADMSEWCKFDEKGHLLSTGGGGGIAGIYYDDGVMPDFYEKAIYIKDIYPLND
jgi:hypothetical protein